MAQQTKKTSILNWQTLSGAGALVAGGIFALYAFGLGSPLSANNQTPQNLTTQGVQNRVQYLNSLEIKGEKGSVTFGYAEKNKVPMLVATGTLNLDNLVVGSTNTTVPTSVVFGGTDNTNSGSSSVIVVGSGNTIAPNAENVILVSSKGSRVGEENTQNAQNVVVLNGENSKVLRGKNIAAFGKNNQVNGSFLTVMGDNNTVNGNHIVAIGGNVDAAKSNIFVFNAKSEEFMPAHESAFYANSKVAINTESGPAQLTIAGGLKIAKTDLSLSGDHRGVIATFSDGAHTGLCGRDGEERGDSDRVPLSEAAREFGLCAGRREAVDIPSPSTTIISQTGVVNGKVYLPRQWIVNDRNPDGKRYPWQWRYGSDKLPGYFLCAENHIPDREGNILGRTGVKCLPCENGTAKPGDLNCTPNQEETVEQPKELTCPANQHIENGVCVANTKQVACNPAGIDKTNGSFTNAMVTVTWNNGAWSQPATCQLSCNPTYTPAKKSASSLHNDYCAKLRWKQESTTQTTPGSCSNKPTEQRYECLDKPEAQEYPYSRGGDVSVSCQFADTQRLCERIVGVKWTSPIFEPNEARLANGLFNGPRDFEPYGLHLSYYVGDGMDKSLMLDYDEVGNPILKDENGWTKIPLELTRICEWTPVSQASCTILNENSCKSNSNCTRTPPKNNIQINYSCVDDQDRKYSDSACAGISK